MTEQASTSNRVPFIRRPAAELREFFVTCQKGVEGALAAEVAQLLTSGRAENERVAGGVRVLATVAEAYRICLWSRVAQRVLMPIHRFRCEDERQLYAGIKAIRWSDHMDVTSTLAVEFTERRSAITHTQYGALKTKDAIVDQFRSNTGERPSIDVRTPNVRVNVHLSEADATVSIDLSGDSLHRRGYREEGASAPLKETLAAAILLLSDWPAIAARGGSFYDPMCGSGTLVVEAALIAADIAPALGRRYFGFLGWKGHDEAAWEQLVREARQRRDIGLKKEPLLIQGSDLQASALRAAKENARRAGLGDRVRFFQRDAVEMAPPPGAAVGLVGSNPPYGERIGDVEALKVVHAAMGSAFKHRFMGWDAFIFTGNSELAAAIGLSTHARETLFNGPIECRLLHYRLFAGKKGGDAPTSQSARRV